VIKELRISYKVIFSFLFVNNVLLIQSTLGTIFFFFLSLLYKCDPPPPEIPGGYTKVKIDGWMGSILYADEGKVFKKCGILIVK